MIATTIPQSKKLSEIGIDPNTADMYYRTTINGTAYTEDTPTVGDRITEWDIPCWSLGALLELLPFPSLEKENDGWFCVICNKKDHLEYYYCSDHYNNPIDTCIEVINWLKEKNYI